MKDLFDFLLKILVLFSLCALPAFCFSENKKLEIEKARLHCIEWGHAKLQDCEPRK